MNVKNLLLVAVVCFLASCAKEEVFIPTTKTNDAVTEQIGNVITDQYEGLKRPKNPCPPNIQYPLGINELIPPTELIDESAGCFDGNYYNFNNFTFQSNSALEQSYDCDYGIPDNNQFPVGDCLDWRFVPIFSVCSYDYP